MRFQLKDYQVDAVDETLRRLERAQDSYRQYGDLGAFALSATTGAGKTVMATAVFEALFFGSEEFDFEADPGATVLWVTDDPSLNEQTRYRILESGDLLGHGQLKVINEGFKQERFDPGTVYFLNIQKLSSTSSMVKRVDKREITLWDTIRNTIEHPKTTLYLVLDEAHRGMKNGAKRNGNEARPTIVQRLVNGHEGVPPAPVVWGISATIERFDAAMKAAGAAGRTLYPNVSVDPVRVQESGLLKDTILLDFPDEAGDFETTLLRTSARDAKQAGALWVDYAAEEGMPEPVVPLLVVQVPNTPKDSDLIRYLDTIYTEWPELAPDAVAHVFGEHKTLELGKYEIPYIAPQRVQDAAHVQVLLAKDAISTGWDCPRAEVMISFRPAQDRTHITQLLGRMVRTPLARRVASDERLNAVTCVLPHFKRDTAVDVAKILTGEKVVEGDDDSSANKGSGRRVLIAPVTMAWNTSVPEAVRDLFASLPTEAPPKGNKKPVKRLLALSAAIGIDKLMDDADKNAHAELYKALDGLMAEHAKAVKKGAEAILTAEIRRVATSMANRELQETTRQEAADARTVEDAFRVTRRALGAKVANGYIAKLISEIDDDEEPDIIDAQARVASLLQLESVLPEVERRATNLAEKWLDDLRVKVKGLSEGRRQVYAEIQQQANEPQRVEIVVPTTRIEETVDEKGLLLPTEKLHILADENGEFPIEKLKGWERQVLSTELAREETLGWYRNPGYGTAEDAVRVPYQMGDKWKPMQPDFIFFSKTHDGSPTASIVDPHGAHLADALPKLKGLAAFAAKYGEHFLRIEAVAEIDGQMRTLDMRLKSVRDEVEAATGADAEALYRSKVAVDYR